MLKLKFHSNSSNDFVEAIEIVDDSSFSQRDIEEIKPILDKLQI